MLYNIEMTVKNSNIDITEIENLDLEIRLDAGGGIEEILVDERPPTDKEIDVINDNLWEIQREVAWQWCQDQERKNSKVGIGWI